jgi:hypothetical protein
MFDSVSHTLHHPAFFALTSSRHRFQIFRVCTSQIAVFVENRHGISQLLKPGFCCKLYFLDSSVLKDLNIQADFLFRCSGFCSRHYGNALCQDCSRAVSVSWTWVPSSVNAKSLDLPVKCDKQGRGRRRNRPRTRTHCARISGHCSLTSVLLPSKAIAPS